MRNVTWCSAIVIIAICLFQVAHGMAIAAESMVAFRWENWDASERMFLDKQRSKLIKQGAIVSEVKETVPNVKNPAAVWLVMAGVAALTVLAETIVDAVKEYKQCGLVADAKGEEIKLRRNCDLDPGEVLVRQPDGVLSKIEFEAKSSTDLIQLMETALTKGRTAKSPRKF